MFNPTKLIFIPPDGNPVDWTNYFMDISPIHRQIESDKPGEAGVIMFDTVTIEMPISKTGSYFTESALFGGNSKPKYHVQIKKQIDGVDYQLFEGLIDLDSLKFTRHGTVQFDCYDKLSALKFYPTQPARQRKSYKAVLQAQGKNGQSFLVRYRADSNQLYVSFRERPWDDPVNNFINLSDVWLINGVNLMHPDGFAGNFYPPYGDVYYKEEWFYNGISELIENGYTQRLTLHRNNPRTAPGYDDYLPFPKNMHVVSDIYYYDETFYGIDIQTDDTFDALKILEAIIKSVYPSITVINRTGWTSFPISYGFFEQTVNMPFDRPILEAIKYLASSMMVYVYMDRQGRFIIDKWPAFNNNNPRPYADLSDDLQIENDYRYTWDKLVDKVTIATVASDGTKTEAVAGTEYKDPVSSLERTVFAQEQSAQDIADAYFAFYGKRHRARSVIRKLDATAAELDLTDWVDLGDKDFRDNSQLLYFIEKMAINTQNDTIELDLVSVKTFDL